MTQWILISNKKQLNSSNFSVCLRATLLMISTLTVLSCIAQRGPKCSLEYEGNTYVSANPESYFTGFGIDEYGQSSPYLPYRPKFEVMPLYALAKMPSFKWRNFIKLWSNTEETIGRWNEVFKVTNTEDGGYQYSFIAGSLDMSSPVYNPNDPYARMEVIYMMQTKEANMLRITLTNTNILEGFERKLTSYYCDKVAVDRQEIQTIDSDYFIRHYALVIGTDLVHFYFGEADATEYYESMVEEFGATDGSRMRTLRVEVE